MPLIQLRNSLKEVKTSHLALCEQARTVKNILESQRGNVEGQDLESLKLFIAHFAIISEKDENTYDLIPDNISDSSYGLEQVHRILENLNQHLGNEHQNEFFVQQAASCCGLANCYLELQALSEKFQLDAQQKNELQRCLIAPAQRLPRLVLFAKLWVDEAAKSTTMPQLASTSKSLLRKFLRLGTRLNQAISPPPVPSTAMGAIIQAFWRMFAPAESGRETRSSVLSESTVLRTEIAEDMSASVAPDEISIADLQNSLVETTAASDLHLEHDLQSSLRRFDQLSEDAKNILSKLKEVNEYLTQRAKETRKNRFLALFGYSGQDYYDRRSHWRLILECLANIANNQATDYSRLRWQLMYGQVSFRTGCFRTRYIDKLKVLAEAISAAPHALQLPEIAGYINLSQKTYRQLDRYTSNTGPYPGGACVLPPEFLSDREAQEAESVNKLSGYLRNHAR